MENKRTENSISFNEVWKRLCRILTDTKANILPWQNEELLTILIKAEKRKLIKSKEKQFFKELLSFIYLPTKTSFFTVLIVVVFFSALSCFLKPALDDKYFRSLITIHAGIGIIIFALIIFIAESLRDDDTKDRARVLLKESYLFPLSVAEILVFFAFLLPKPNIFIVVPVLLVGSASICSLWRLISVLLNKNRFTQKRTELLIERLEQSIDLAIDERVGNNILVSMLDEKEIMLEYSPFMSKKSRFHYFKAEKTGIVVDINLDKLRGFANLIEEEANKSGYAFKDKSDLIEPIINTDSETKEESKKEEYKKKQLRYVLKLFHSIVNEEQNNLFCIDEDLVKDDKKLRLLKNIANQIFTIKSSNNFLEEVRSELSGVKDQFITEISNKHIGKVEELVKLYLDLADGFLKYMKTNNSVYSFEHASKERGALVFDQWKQIKGWLLSDIRTVYEKAMESHDNEIIRRVGSLPIAIAKRAIGYQDHYLFQDFIRFSELLYSHAFKEKDEQLRDMMVERSWMHLKETADYYVEPEMEKDYKKEELINLKDFGVYLFLVLQNLLKRTFEKRDLANFKKYNYVVSKLFTKIQSPNIRFNIQRLERQLERGELSGKEKVDINKSLNHLKIFQNLKKEIKQKKQQMIFGFASWVLSRLSLRREDEEWLNFYDVIQNSVPSGLEELTELFMQVYNFEDEDFWGRNWWDVIADGEVREIDSLGKLEVFYCVKSLQIITSITEDKAKEANLTFNRSLVFMTEKDNKLMKILDDISVKSEEWKFVLSDDAIQKVSLFKEILEMGKTRYEQKEKEDKRLAKISQNKVDKFKDNVLEGYNSRSSLRNILKYYKLYEDKTNENYEGDLNKYGINTVDAKEAFFDEWYVSYGNDWGANYGDSLASNEKSDFFEKIAKECTEINESDLRKRLAQFDDISEVIILNTSEDFYKFPEISECFKSKWDEDVKQIKLDGFVGYYSYKESSIPVFETYHREMNEQILILNKAKFGTLVQYSPLNEGENIDLVKENLFINIQSFSEDEELMKEFIDKPTDWLKKKGDENKQRAYLKERVIIQVLERFEFKKHEEFEGYVVKLKEENIQN